MSTEIRRADKLTDDEKQQLFGWGEDIFGVNSLNLRWRGKDLHFTLFEDGEAASHVGLLQHVVEVNGQPLTVGGVGAVVTRKQSQGKGYARRLMQQAADFMKQEWRVDAGLLFCFDRLMPFYQSLGWQLVAEPVMVEQPPDKIAAPLNVMMLPLNTPVWPAGAVELRGLPW